MAENTNRWLPLESNPDVMNKYVRALGVSSAWSFVDVWGLDSEMLTMVTRPIAAILLLYPISKKSESEKLGEVESDSNLYFMKQTIRNACGTIGLIHALCNNDTRLGFDSEKHLSKFFSSTKGLSPEDRGKHLESDTAFGEAHDESAQEGQTRAPSRDEKVDLHFVVFVHNGGKLYELDGNKDGPVFHGPTTEDTLLEDTAEVIKKFMARDPDSLNFTVVALSKSD